MSDPTLTPTQLATLSDVCVVANTPAYLFKHFRKNPIVQELARRHSAPELLDYSRRSANANPMTLDRMTEAYAGLIAATLRPFDELQQASNDGWPKIRWAEEIREIDRGAPSNNTSVVVVSSSPLMKVVNAPAAETAVGRRSGSLSVKTG